ncbi:hypothetical protein C7974DRAFT_408532 [Boeremia exigua]|uniref:uncharacterized protein n=1 Tax=Boeremia exigua TaxID=749465 RepID=UPI001E8EB87F|nr:uncharacterized protein C7974DRAFT_408532 [Boeremia exigua]KAH6644886.1 hypothetical protein C7974DRAFT_408532 [Boeremia exigua]
MTAPQTAPLDLTKVPLAANPSGAPPNFDNPSTLVDEAWVTGVVLVVLGRLCLAFRLGTNLKLSKKFCLDDYLCVFTLTGGIAYWVLNLLSKSACTFTYQGVVALWGLLGMTSGRYF